MKKFLSVILALVMVFSLSVTALAIDDTTWNGTNYTGSSNIQNVTATYTAATTEASDPVYAVVIEWNVTNATFDGGKTVYVWNAEDLHYVVDNGSSVAQSETKASINVKVINRSNAQVVAAVAYADNTSDTAVTTLDSTWGNATLGSAAIDSEENTIAYTNTTSVGTAQEAVWTSTVTVDDYSKLVEGYILGTVTVTLTKNA